MDNSNYQHQQQSTGTNTQESPLHRFFSKLVVGIVSVYFIPYAIIKELLVNHPHLQYLGGVAWIIFACVATYYVLKWIILAIIWSGEDSEDDN